MNRRLALVLTRLSLAALLAACPSTIPTTAPEETHP